ncbi:hypothetical protein [Streptomyces halobius]|uniref:Uncharacterized protein n=1 Tax=Streptomyces halobius TaxID=2879846 RepID=A0ABY4MIH9_9ACTN|nr:hypothetical protein [Streptomyces halobius]UQA97052.1 hypothetical protein K9S39_38900 [Streptomyces halobius]
MSNNGIEVSYLDGKSYRIRVRGHEPVVDQPVDAGRPEPPIRPGTTGPTSGRAARAR